MLLDVFADKRCTGMNFDRPEFERLLKALQERKVNCIVVKDFSRLGRNFVETGQYLEQVFPLFGVRFIAIKWPSRTSSTHPTAGMSNDTMEYLNVLFGVCKRFKTDYYHATPKQREFIDAVATHEYQLMKAHEKGLSRASVPPFMGMKRSERSNNMPA